MSRRRRPGWTGWWTFQGTGWVPDPCEPAPQRIAFRIPAPPPPAPHSDADHVARHGHEPLWGKNSLGHRICHECRRISKARWRERQRVPSG